MTKPKLVSQPDPSALHPIFPTARLVKGAVLEADQLRQEAEALEAQAQADAERLRAEAVEAGRREGAERFVGLIDAATMRGQEQGVEFADQVMTVALRVARAVIDVEFATKPERITDLIKTALAQVRDRSPKRVVAHLHPEDYALVAGRESEFAGLTPDDAAFGFVQDTDVPRHGVQLETELGHYDFAVEQQLDRLREQLLG
ncbi:MAG: FliH/SctL family protein [Planctomycetota bacterium]